MDFSSLSLIVLLGGVCEKLSVAFLILAIISLIFGIIFLINLYCDSYSGEKEKLLRRGGILALVFTVVFSITAALIPSEKAVYMVAGIELVNQFSKTETAKELGDSGMSIVKDITSIIHKYTITDEDRRDSRDRR
jgi:hypothetical protein